VGTLDKLLSVAWALVWAEMDTQGPAVELVVEWPQQFALLVEGHLRKIGIFAKNRQRKAKQG
jgi:hypothetical protein